LEFFSSVPPPKKKICNTITTRQHSTCITSDFFNFKKKLFYCKHFIFNSGKIKRGLTTQPPPISNTSEKNISNGSGNTGNTKYTTRPFILTYFAREAASQVKVSENQFYIYSLAYYFSFVLLLTNFRLACATVSLHGILSIPLHACS
jgi:hypothetical protein